MYLKGIYNMEFKDKVNQLLKRSFLRHTKVDFTNFVKQDNNTYIYNVVLPVADYLDKHDNKSRIACNTRIEKFNKMAKAEFTYVKVLMEDIDVQKGMNMDYDGYVTLRLKADFSKE